MMFFMSIFIVWSGLQWICAHANVINRVWTAYDILEKKFHFAAEYYPRKAQFYPQDVNDFYFK